MKYTGYLANFTYCMYICPQSNLISDEGRAFLLIHYNLKHGHKLTF